jgi:putative ABC transport system substrate-binding protein
MSICLRRREFIAGLGSAAAWPLAAGAQQRALPVIGILGSTMAPEPNAPGVSDAFMQGLKDIGFVEGQNMAIEARWANNQYDRLPAMAAELVRARVALIYATGNYLPARAAKNATSTIPIVFAMGADPVQLGIVDGLSRPGRRLLFQLARIRIRSRTPLVRCLARSFTPGRRSRKVKSPRSATCFQSLARPRQRFQR